VSGHPDRAAALVGRREVLTSLAAGITGAVAAPGASAGEPESPQNGAREQTAPQLLDDHRRTMLANLAEQLVPGSTAAGVHDLLDRVMAVESLQTRTRFLNALGAFDREARDRHGRGWLEIDDAQRLEILRAASTLASARPAPPSWTRGQPVERAPQPPTPPANLRDHFDHLRDLVVRAYATTAPGMTELGFTGRMVFPSFPGCTHPGDDHRS
jgi:hypothetical protein